jgi:hypothetical protein
MRHDHNGNVRSIEEVNDGDIPTGEWISPRASIEGMSPHPGRGKREQDPSDTR